MSDETYFGEDELAEETLSEIERRNELERDGRIGAEVYLDIVENGPLGLYLKERRQLAKDALLRLAEINPKDGIAIAEQQAVVKEFLIVTRWVRSRIDAAIDAEQTIKREYGNAET